MLSVECQKDCLLFIFRVASKHIILACSSIIQMFLTLISQKLQEDRVALTKRRDTFKKVMQRLNAEYEALKTQLQENETHAQVRFILPGCTSSFIVAMHSAASHNHSALLE